jgi:hypothetical protein
MRAPVTAIDHNITEGTVQNQLILARRIENRNLIPSFSLSWQQILHGELASTTYFTCIVDILHVCLT